MTSDKIVNFPGTAREATPKKPPSQGIYEVSPDARMPYINTREGIFPMAGLDRQQRERLWQLWDLCDHLKRACTNATGDDSTTLALSHALKHLMGQLNYRISDDETDPN